MYPRDQNHHCNNESPLMFFFLILFADGGKRLIAIAFYERLKMLVGLCSLIIAIEVFPYGLDM